MLLSELLLGHVLFLNLLPLVFRKFVPPLKVISSLNFSYTDVPFLLFRAFLIPKSLLIRLSKVNFLCIPSFY